MIELQDIYKSFGDNDVLKGITTEFLPGKTNLVIGKSGSGKTVCIKCSIGLFEVDKGSVIYDGRNFTTMSKGDKKSVRKEIGMLFQGNALFDSMTVEENVRFPLDMFSDQTKAQKNARVDEVLERVELEDAHKKYPSEISGGMQKRVGIARAIVLQPKYLFCDEPNSGLDPQTALVIDELIKEITIEQNITTVINTHDMNSVMGIGDNILFIHEGHKHWQGSSDEILTSNNKELEDFIFASEFLKKLKNQQI